jgi:hypothetical protein
MASPILQRAPRINCTELLSVTRSPGMVAPVRLTGRVRYGDGAQEDLWFEGPESLNDRDGTPWLSALLPLVARTGESIRIPLPVDAEFLLNARALLRLWRSWYPSLVTVVDIDADTPTSPRARGHNVGTFFSAGVDSWFTALRRRDISHWIVCLGFDMPVTSVDVYRRHRDRLAAIAQRAGKPLISCATNIRQTRWGVSHWEHLCFGPALGMTAHFLGSDFRRVYVPGSFDFSTLRPWGSHPLSDNLFTSSSTEVLHEGAEATRYEKTEYLCGSDLAIETLHVCYRGQSGLGQDDTNCCACQKCLRTMIALEILGKLEHARLFDASKLTPERIEVLFVNDVERPFFGELETAARERGLVDIADAMARAVRKSGPVERCLRIADRLQATPWVWRAAGPVRSWATAGMIAR